MPSYYAIDFDKDFAPLYGDLISIPPNTIMWRGFDPKYPIVSDRPAYFGSQIFAQGYANRYNDIARPFVTGKYLKLIDIRFMKALLLQILRDNEIKKEDEKIIGAISVALGLCSLEHQIKTFKKLYGKYVDYFKNEIKELEKHLKPDSLYEQQGFRIAETSTDAHVMGFLKGLFSGVADGFIAPPTFTAFHLEKKDYILNSEVIIFNPKLADMSMLDMVMLPGSEADPVFGIISKPNLMPSSAAHATNVIPLNKIPTRTIHEIILTSEKKYTYISYLNYETETYIPNRKSAGGGGNEICMTDYNYLIDSGNKTILKYYNDGLKAANKWRAKKGGYLISAVAPAKSIPFDPDFLK
jgi:hypothetical protein